MEIQNNQFENKKIIIHENDQIIIDVNQYTQQIAIMNGSEYNQIKKQSFPIIKLYSSNSLNLLNSFVIPFQFIRSIKFSNLGLFLIIYGLNNEIGIKNLQNNSNIVILYGHKVMVEEVMSSNDDQILISGAGWDSIIIWSLVDYNRIFVIPLITQLKALCISPINDILTNKVNQINLNFLITASIEDETIITWNCKQLKPYYKFEINNGVEYLEYSSKSINILIAYRKYTHSILIINQFLKIIIRQFELYSVRLATFENSQYDSIISIGTNNLTEQKSCIHQFNWTEGSLIYKENLNEGIVLHKLLDKQKIIITKYKNTTKFWIQL